ncbi:MAG: hypothetical protein K1X54_08905 [Flavobacteriales bacterium]|nr:hypothetical protein [Flavobacteriales bacterium]
MKYQSKKVAGVWIDHQHAYIIGNADLKSQGDYGVIKKIVSKHHADHSSSEDAHHHRIAQEIKQMYEHVAEQIQAAEAIYITGPGNAQEELRNYLMKDRKFQGKEIALGTSDHPTDNQRVAEIRKHFTV